MKTLTTLVILDADYPLDEIVEYGTDADCRAKLDAVSAELAGDTIQGLRNRIEELELSLTTAQEAEKEYHGFFDGVTYIIGEYSGRVRWATPASVLPIIEDAFQQLTERVKK